jgi:hypothetical protein
MRTGSERLGDWIRKQVQTIVPGSGASGSPSTTRADDGEYRLLHKYLRDRFANRLVLSFSEIEDILGFSLPESARQQQEWWATDESVARGSAQSESWTLASRTATVNMAAQNVMFERETPLEASRRR